MMKHINFFFESLILEKSLMVGDKLKSVLSKMKHPFASLILSNLGKDIIDSSYIELDSDSGMVTWLPVNRETDFKTKKELSEPEKWIDTKRVKQPIARIIKAILDKTKTSFNDIDIERFVNEYKAFQKPSNFILAEGNDIVTNYSERRYTHDKEEHSSLGGSCMKGEDKRHFFSVYKKNPNVRLVVMLDEYNYVAGRAILWLNAEIDGKPVIFMDRIYTAKQAYEELFKNYAIDNGWWFKTLQSASNGEISNGKEKKLSPIIRVILPNLNWDDYEKPYMDTLEYFKEEYVGDKFAYTLNNYANNTDWKEQWRKQDGGVKVNNLYESPAMEMRILSSELELDQTKLIPQKSKGVYQYGKSKYWITKLEDAKRRCLSTLMRNDNWKRFANIKFLSGRYDYLIRDQIRDKVSNDLKSNPLKYVKIMGEKLTPYFWVSELTSNIIDGNGKEFLTLILEKILKNKANYKKFYVVMYGEMYRYENKDINKLSEYTEENITSICNLFNEYNTRIMRQFIIDSFEKTKNRVDKKFNEFVIATLPEEQLIDVLESLIFNRYEYSDIIKMNPDFFDNEIFLQEVYKDVGSSKYSLKWVCQTLSSFTEVRAKTLSVDGIEINFSEKYIYRIK